MKKLIKIVLNILYPRCCPLCHQILTDQNRMICPDCEKQLEPVTGHFCMKCGKPVGETEEYCRDCLRCPGSFDRGRGIFLYSEKMRRSLVRFKYYGCREYGDFYGTAISAFAKEEIMRWKPDLIVPVPLHQRKQRRRGFNQAEYIARRVSLCTGIPIEAELVKKNKDTKSQKKLNSGERRNNLSDAFCVQAKLTGMTILVIDDVYTTGSTMDAMARSLKAAGAEKVYFLTLCIGLN